MIKSLVLIQKRISLMLIALIVTSAGYSAVYTAVASGNYSSTTVWSGGIAPPYTIALDQIIIPAGFTVNMDNNVTVNGALAALSVEGTLNTSNSSSLTLTTGAVTGAGTVMANIININTGATLSLTGSLVATTLNVGTALSSAADMVVAQTLNLTSGGLVIAAGGSLDLGPGATIVLSGGTLNTAGGTVGLAGNYNVDYINVSTIAGAELSGSGLQNITVNAGAANAVTLTADLTIGGTLALTSGALTLAGNDLTINGGVAASGTGTVASTVASSISINTTGGTAGTLTFSGAAAAVNNLTVNVGAGNQTHIGGTVTVNGTLQLNSGTLTFDNTNLTISGNVGGAGLLSGTTTSNLTVNTIGGLATALNFAAAGQSINDFTITVGLNNAVLIGSDLTLGGVLALTGNLNLNGNSLTLNPASVMSGTGMLIGSATSDLTVNSIAGATVAISGPIHDLTVNTGVAGVTAASAFTVVGMLTLQSGSLILNGNNLTLSGNVAATGTGTIASTLASDVTVATSVSPTGSLNFSSSANTVGNLVMNISGGGVANVGTDLNVNDTLRFIAGKLNVAGNALILGATSVIQGSGVSSYIVTTAGGYLQRQVSVTSLDSMNFPVGTALQFAPANIRLNAGSSSGPVQVGVVSNVLLEATTGTDLSATQPLVDATWDVHSLITGTLNLDLEVLWSAAMEVNTFNRNLAYISHYVNGSWDVNGSSAANAEAGSMFSIHRTNITSLSPFTVFGQNAVTPVTEVNNDVTFAIYPNPATDNLIIQNTNVIAEPVQMDIYSVTGQLMNNYRLTNATTNVSVNNLVAGSYLVKFYNSKMSSTKQFIKM